MVLHQIHKRLQAAFAEPALHPLKPLRGVVHLGRYGADHHDGLRPATGGFLHGDRIADAAVEIAHAVQQHAAAVKTGNGAGGANQVKPGLLGWGEVVWRVIIAATGAHPELFAGIEQS